MTISILFNMHKHILAFLLCLFAAAIFAQQRPTPPHFEADAPAWARMLLEDSPNVRDVQAAYREYYDERPFQKNKYTQFYKRWMQWARPYAQADGSLLISDCGLRIADCARSTAPNRKSSIVNRQS